MNNQNVIIFGNSDFAKLVHYYLKTNSDYNIVAFCVDDEYINTDTFDGLPLISYSKLKKEYSSNDFKMFVAIGYSKLNSIREKIFNKLKNDGYKFISYIHSSNIFFPPPRQLLRLERTV